MATPRNTLAAAPGAEVECPIMTDPYLSPQNSPLELSPQYRPGGGVRWDWFLPGAFLTGLAALAMGWCLHRAFIAGWYLLLVAPIIAALPVLGLVSLTVWFSHCRNRSQAFLLGVGVGLLVHPGHYYVAMVDLVGVQNAHHVEWFPRYLSARMQTDVIEDAHAPPGRDRKGPNAGPKVLFNWAFFIAEVAVVAGLLGAVGWARAGKAYCEECRTWMASQTTRLPAGTGERVAELFAAGNLAELESLRPAKPVAPQGACEVAVDYCPTVRSEYPRCPVYLTVKETVVGRMRRTPKSRILLRQALLDDAQVASLAVTFPVLQRVVGGTVPIGQPAPGPEVVPARPTGAVAEVRDVPPPYGNRVLTRPRIWIGTVIALLPALSLPIGFGLLGAAAYYGDTLPIWASATLGVSGIASFAIGALLLAWYADFLPSRYLYRATKRELELRPERWVDPNNSEAAYIQVIPRENWSRVMLENASDVGLLWVDAAGRQVLFEGDRQRYRIPAGSIVSCEIEQFTAPGDAQQRSIFYMTCIRARTEAGLWETLVSHRHIWFGKRTSAVRRKLAEELREKIRSILA